MGWATWDRSTLGWATWDRSMGLRPALVGSMTVPFTKGRINCAHLPSWRQAEGQTDLGERLIQALLAIVQLC